jgi:hypothetical protein
LHEIEENIEASGNLLYFSKYTRRSQLAFQHDYYNAVKILLNLSEFAGDAPGGGSHRPFAGSSFMTAIGCAGTGLRQARRT